MDKSAKRVGYAVLGIVAGLLVIGIVGSRIDSRNRVTNSSIESSSKELHDLRTRLAGLESSISGRVLIDATSWSVVANAARGVQTALADEARATTKARRDQALKAEREGVRQLLQGL